MTYNVSNNGQEGVAIGAPKDVEEALIVGSVHNKSQWEEATAVTVDGIQIKIYNYGGTGMAIVPTSSGTFYYSDGYEHVSANTISSWVGMGTGYFVAD